MPSRRQFLAGTALAGLGAVGVGSVVPIGDIATSEPPTDAWPQPRRDAANTASTDATLPSDPSVAWEKAAISRSFDATVLVNADSVYVGGVGIAAFDRESGRRRWSVDSADDRIAVRDGIVYAAASRGGVPDYTLRGFDAATGSKQFESPLGDSGDHTSPAFGLVVTDDGLFVGCHGRLLGFSLDGASRWTARAMGSVVRPMVHEGTLYATQDATVRRYGSRDLLATVLNGGPDPVWRGEDSTDGPPTVVGDYLLVGNHQTLSIPTDSTVTAYARDSGERAWSAVEGSSGHGDWVSALTPARAGGESAPSVGITAVSRGENTDRRYAVVGLNLDDGSVRWRHETAAEATAVAGVEGGFVVAERGENNDVLSGTVRAYGIDGEERWTVELDSPVLDIAPVEDELFAPLRDGRVVALR